MPLVLAATPLGNPADASRRLRESLETADVIAAEDTRRLRRLLRELDVTARGRVVSYFEHNEEHRASALIDELRAGHTVVVVTDAGMPSVSDPGYRLVAAAVADGIQVSVVPGPSAVTAALAVSGLPSDRWCFEGFPPRKAGDRRRTFADLAAERRTLVFFEAPHRLRSTLDDMVTAFGPGRRAAVCRELTKTFEEVRRGDLAELAAWAAEQVRGEITLVVAGAEADDAAIDDAVLAAAVEELRAAGLSAKDAITQTATRYAVPRRHVYAVAHGATNTKRVDERH